MGTETGIRGHGTYRDSSRYGRLESETPRRPEDFEQEQETRPSIARRTGNINHFGIQYCYSTLRLKVDYVASLLGKIKSY